MKISLKILIFATLLLCPILAFSQGSGSSEMKKDSATKNKSGKNNFVVTKSATGLVTSITSNSLTIKNKSGKNMVYFLTKNSRFVGTRPRNGENVKITYSANDRKITVVRKS
jgi:hypothetical protein